MPVRRCSPWPAAGCPGPDEHPHPHGDYLDAFAAAGLVARRRLEPPLTREQARARAKGLHPELHEAALTGLPAVIVWDAERER